MRGGETQAGRASTSGDAATGRVDLIGHDTEESTDQIAAPADGFAVEEHRLRIADADAERSTAAAAGGGIAGGTIDRTRLQATQQIEVAGLLRDGAVECRGFGFGEVAVHIDHDIGLREAENRELRRANEILKAASAFFGAELDRLAR